MSYVSCFELCVKEFDSFHLKVGKAIVEKDS